MNEPSKQALMSAVSSAIVPIPLDSSLQHSHFRQLTNCIQDIHEVIFYSSHSQNCISLNTLTDFTASATRADIGLHDNRQ